MSTSAANLDTQPFELACALPAWRVELNAKLEAHRQRQPASQTQPLSGARGSGGNVAAGSAKSRVAARVAERYANAPSYSDLLAADAAAATAAAEAVAVAAQQAYEAAQVLITNLSGHQAGARKAQEHHGEWDTQGNAEDARHTGGAAGQKDWRVQPDPEPAAMKAAGESDRPFLGTIEHHEPLPARSPVPPRSPSQPGLGGIVDAFEEASVFPALSLPAKLIEFPRELIASRKARPRVAEGPLAEAPLFESAEIDRVQDSASLRIFEVQGASDWQEQSVPTVGQATVSAADTRDIDYSERHAGPAPDGRLKERAVQGRDYEQAADEGSTPGAGRGSRVDPASLSPEWQSIRLGAYPEPESEPATLSHRGRPSVAQTHAPLHPAPIGDRVMAELVDLAIVGAAFLVFVLVFTSCTTHPPVGKAAFAFAGVILAALAVFYQWLFMSYGGGTLGMRYAGIALCTFEDENPTRSMLRTRVGASVLSALPLGLGLLWAIFDEDGLGWHDRLSRCYPRSYR